MNKILIIIPVYNEEENISSVIQELQQAAPSADILAINDCSQDETEQILRKSGVNYINCPYNLGYSGVLQTGFKYALTKGYPFVAQFDGDGQHVASELVKMFDEMNRKSCDILIGSRFLEKSDYHHPFLRRFGTGLFRIAIRMITKTRITDPTSGMQVLSKRVYSYYAQKFNYPEFPDANLVTEMILSGYKVRDVAVIMKEREFGESMHSGLLKSGKYMIKMIYSLILMIFRFPRHRRIVIKQSGAKSNELYEKQ